MALDEAILDSVAANPSSAMIRTYEWSVPTLSLGYFQEIAEAEADPRWSGVPIVRRPTGGGALWHDLEVTYAVVVPGDHPSARPSRRLYHTVHRAIVEGLRSMGIPADLRGESEFDLNPVQRPFLCFTDRDPADIVFRNVKLVGSAQRRRSGAVLQHGSFLLSRSIRTPELPGLVDLASIPAGAATWAAFLRSILPEALGLAPTGEDLPAEVSRRAEFLASEIYGDRSWTYRR